MPFILTRRHIFAVAPAALLGACAAQPQPQPAAAGAPQTSAAPGRPDASIEIDQTQVSFIGSVGWGSGTLIYQGRRYPFRIRGLGIGGFGVARMTALGEVYGMPRLADFPGLYGQLRAGLVAGDAQLRGGVWLENPAGVRLNLRPEREGVALQVGADGMLIQMQ